ncbi:MAG TPA: putative sulfate exporter family transporter, partial [Magnetospirillaceae bacterium]|nr:putative sulfate exporter family transporter [Magnetospirillaceae bacterium]
ASVLPKHEKSERDTILTVVTVTALSTLAMIFYPILVKFLGFDDVHAGVFLGGTIHDVAQVIGAGLTISPEAGDVATYVKLLRVAMLLPVVSIIASTAAQGEGKAKGPKVPTFLIGFAVLVAINSTGVLPGFVVTAVSQVSTWCLVTAIAALGMKTSFKSLVVVGWRPVGLMVIETAWILVLVLLSVRYLV